MICRLGVVILTISYIAVTSALPPCVCTRDRNPVCGSDGQTYSNECMFNCKRTTDPELSIEKRGPCEPEPPLCICTYEYAPLCGTNGVTYPNKCSLTCERSDVEIAYKGECRPKREIFDNAELPPCVCTREQRPVCGTDGKTYSNPCMLNCAREANENLHIDHTGRCKTAARSVGGTSCACTRNFAPVCASNGVTYSNECLMRCSGEELSIITDGPCDFA